MTAKTQLNFIEILEILRNTDIVTLDSIRLIVSCSSKMVAARSKT